MANKDVTWDGMDEKKQLLEFFSVQFSSVQVQFASYWIGWHCCIECKHNTRQYKTTLIASQSKRNKL